MRSDWIWLLWNRAWVLLKEWVRGLHGAESCCHSFIIMGCDPKKKKKKKTNVNAAYGESTEEHTC